MNDCIAISKFDTENAQEEEQLWKLLEGWVEDVQ